MNIVPRCTTWVEWKLSKQRREEYFCLKAKNYDLGHVDYFFPVQSQIYDDVLRCILCTIDGAVSW